MSILLRYQGPAVDDGAMNVYDAAASMVAFSDFVVVAAHKLYGEDVQVKAEVTAYKHASFGTDLLFEVVGASMAVLPFIPDIVSVATTVKESIELFRFLKGEKPASIQYGDNNTITVTNNGSGSITVNAPTYHVTIDPKAGEAAERFIGEALSKPGVDRVEITSQGTELAQATKDEASYFRRIGHEDLVTENVARTGLIIESLSFKEGNKWRMWNGGESLLYAMEDEEFSARVNEGEAFRKGDILECDVRVTQTKSNGGLKIQRAIVKVYDHKVASEQSTLGFEE